MARVSWWVSTIVVCIFSMINVLLVYTLPCNSGFMIGSCDWGRILVLFLSLWIIVVYLILCGFIRFTIKYDNKLTYHSRFNKRVFILAFIFSVFFMEMTLASLFGEPNGTWWFSPLLDSIALKITMTFILPILPLIVVLILLADRLGII